MKKRFVLIFVILLCRVLNIFGQTINIHSISTVRQLTGDNGYTLDGTHMVLSKVKLLNPGNFSDTGIYKKNINIHSAYFTSGSLEKITQVKDIDIFFFGSFDNIHESFVPFTEAEIDSLYEWSVRGGKMIIAEQRASNDHVWENLGDKWDYKIVTKNPSEIRPNEIGKSTKIFNGPFGKVSSASQGGFAQGYLKMFHENTVTLATDANGNSTLILDCKTMDLICADVDAYTDLGGLSVSTEILNEQDIFWANTIAFMDSLEPFPEPVIEYDGTNLKVGKYNLYQWIYNWDTIEGANDSTYIPSIDGYYRVIVKSNFGCIDTSNFFEYGSPLEPAIGCPENVTAYTDAGKNFATASLSIPKAYDHDGIASITNNAPDTFPLGTTNITWTVTDNEGYSSTCTHTVTVIDNEPPKINCLENISTNNDAGKGFATILLGIPSTSDNDQVASVTNNAPSNFPIGMTLVTWTVTDNSGNTATCEQTVSVTDNEKPTISCPTNISTNNDTGKGYATISLGIPTTNDNDQVTSVTNNAPNNFPIGITKVTWTVIDNSGNIANCIQEVHVTDIENPIITCLANIITGTNANTNFAILSLDIPETSDNDDVVSVTNNAPITFPVGTTTIIWTVTDRSGNIATCEQTITVIDYNNLSIPNIITPNGDGKNDYFVIEDIPENSELIIFDRSNKIVYKSPNYQNNWDGTDMQNRQLINGTYWFVLNFSFGNKYSGFIVINK